MQTPSKPCERDNAVKHEGAIHVFETAILHAAASGSCLAILLDRGSLQADFVIKPTGKAMKIRAAFRRAGQNTILKLHIDGAFGTAISQSGKESPGAGRFVSAFPGAGTA